MQVQQQPAHVAVAEYERRMLLVNGYHRTFQWANRHLSENGSGGELSILFPVSTILPFHVPPDQQTRDFLFAPRAPLFRDFFDDRLALPVRMRRKKRYEMSIQTRITGVDQD